MPLRWNNHQLLVGRANVTAKIWFTAAGVRVYVGQSFDLNSNHVWQVVGQCESPGRSTF